MKFIIGTKQYMSEIHQPDGRVVPVTLVRVTPCVVTAVRVADRDGYQAVQVGTGTRRRLTKPLAGQFGSLGAFRYVNEFRPRAGEALPEMKVGDTVAIDQFTVGDKVTVTADGKGRGFQGVVKRHGFHGSPKTHGHKDQLRMPGSIGSTGPARVFKGVRMGGRMGGVRVTVKNLEVVAVDTARGELSLKGAIPGARQTVVLIRSAR